MPAVPTAARGAVITGWGAALPDKVVTNDDLARQRPRHQRRVDHRADRDPRAPRRRVDRVTVDRGRAPGDRAGRARRGADRRPGARHHHAGSHRARHLDDGPGRARAALRRLRRQRRVLRVHVRAGPRPRHGRHRRPEDPGHRHRHALAHRRLDRPQHRRTVRRRLRRRRPRGDRGPRPVPRLGPRRRRDGRRRCSSPRSAA